MSSFGLAAVFVCHIQSSPLPYLLVTMYYAGFALWARIREHRGRQHDVAVLAALGVLRPSLAQRDRMSNRTTRDFIIITVA